MTQIQNAIYQMKETSMNIGSMVKTSFLGTWFAILFVKFHVHCHGSKVATINQMLR